MLLFSARILKHGPNESHIIELSNYYWCERDHQLAYQKTIPNSKWNMLLMVSYEWMTAAFIKENVQFVDYLTVTRSMKVAHWNLGCISAEVFGLFVMPLAGSDWRINERNILFDILPGNLTFEHKINKQFYYGACFRARDQI